MAKVVRIIVVVGIIILPVTKALGAIIAVPEYYAKIGVAISHANNGDTISVRPGSVAHPDTFVEQINFMGKDLLVTARNQNWQSYGDIDNPDPRATVIDISPILDSLPPDSQSVVYMNSPYNGELRGFTVTGGKGTGSSSRWGGGVSISEATHAIMRKCIVKDDTLVCEVGMGEVKGGGVFIAANAHVLLVDCEIKGNALVPPFYEACGLGAGVAAVSATEVEIRDCKITGNTTIDIDDDFVGRGGGIYMEDVPDFLIVNNEIKSNHCRNDGGGTYVRNSQGKIKGNTIESNSSGYQPGGELAWCGRWWRDFSLNNSNKFKQACFG